MAVCFFNNDLNNRYRCTYTIEKDSITVSAEYDIFDEIPSTNGFHAIGNNNFESRDILIADSDNSKFYLLKDAYYAGNSNRYALLDNKSVTIFKSGIYFSHGKYDKLTSLPETPKCSSIRIFSKDFIAIVGNNSYQKKKNDDELIISLKKKNEPIDFDISTSKIKKILFNDWWEQNEDWKIGKVVIDITPYVEIQFKRRQNYNDIYKYVYEFEIYMQLYTKGGFKVDDIWLNIEDSFYRFKCQTRGFEYKERKNYVVTDSMASFLEKCYSNINYAHTNKMWLRNIPYAIGVTSRNIEDSFLLYYKFVECFFKSKNEKGASNRFIAKAIEENYKCMKYTDDEVSCLSREIVCLRNHYIHSGYFIKNNKLKISRPKEDSSFQEYVANADFEWLYERTSILKKASIDIIYKEILGYDNYSY
ncbi:hypothetical protein NXH64_04030 [Butyrivibrio fibrisolvens]|uniref:hypothetical protein n=1 Tax=Pseudobutyrivibrio ruminis TaxID=46206 RepID=UPI00041496E1|nr:hypothetical protein [Pseudobutyrivibrio ruminis]MDC7278667.1 hypothetical protein [Butyrivibrio fibrisolvens]